MSDDRKLELSAGRLRLVLVPSIGGSIGAFDWVDGAQIVPILRQSPEELRKSLDASSFPLVPYVNRIRGGVFHFRGREIRLRPNMAGDPSPLHGQGWLHSWSVRDADDRRAQLIYLHEPGEWPWRYEASQEFMLDEHGYTTTLACRNLGPGPMPCGLGQHPYFQCGPQTRLQTVVRDVWTVDEHVLPVAKVPADGRFDLSDRLVCGQSLDNGFAGWGGEAHMSDPAWPFKLRLSSSEAKFFQLYSPQSGGIFVAEPVTHANAALNGQEDEWQALGIRILEQNEIMRLTIRLEVIPR